MQPQAPHAQLVLEFLKGASAYTTVLFFEQRNISQLQSQNESNIDKYMRKMKRTIKSRPDGDCSADRKPKKNELVFRNRTQHLNY